MSDDEETEKLAEVKVVLLGEAGVGKSSIIKQYVTKSFDPDIDSSISSKYISKELEISDIDKKLKYNLWDTAGQEKYRSLAKIFYKDANVIVFVYSIDNIKSFEGLKNYWYEEVKSNCLSNVIFGVVGNKNDLYSQAQVNEQEARQWADSIGGIFQLTSAKTDSGIELLFQNLGKKFFNPDFDYKKEDEEAKKNYEMKKKEKENKKKDDDNDNDDVVKIPEVKSIKLNNKDITKKNNNYAHWFVDGKDYFEDLYEKLMDAKRTIFITDWWLSPEVWLKRPILEADYIKPSKKKKDNLSRLMDILYFKANEGIKIYILIYYECSLALTLNSKYTQDTLEKLHKNIKVTRHPKDKFDLLWSHHEKLVVIDQQIGYVGGLDLCWGRYDFPEHPIYEPDNSEQKYYFPFIDYSNARICDFSNVEDYLKESVPRKNSLRMPWHDVHTRIIGPAVGDIAKHFVERWNHDNYDNKTETNPNTVRGSTNFKENNKLKSSNFSKNGFMNTIFESIQKHINNDNTNNNKDINVITEKTISEEESKTSEVYENYNIQNKIKIPPDFTCQNNDINDLGNINENEEQKKTEENISINIKETKINIIQVENDTKSFDDSVKLKTVKIIKNLKNLSNSWTY